MCVHRIYALIQVMRSWTGKLRVLRIFQKKNRIGIGLDSGTRGDICTSGVPNDFFQLSGTHKSHANYPEEPIPDNHQGNDLQKIVEKLNHPRATERLEAVKYLAKKGPAAKPALSALVLKLVDFDIRVREAARQALLTIDKDWTADSVVKPILPQLVRALGKSPTREPQWAYQVLIEIGRSAVPELTKALSDETDDILQVWAARSLGGIGTNAAEAAVDLGKALHNPKVQIRQATAEALVELNASAEPALSNLVRALSDKHPPVRIGAIRALQRIGPAAGVAIPGLVNLLSDPVDDVHKGAMDALAAIGGKAVPLLIRILENRTRRRAEAFTELLDDMIEITKRVDPSALGHYREESHRNLLWHLEFALERSPEKIHEAATTILGMIGPEAKEAIPVLIEASKDENALLRREAVQALGQIGPETEAALTTLVEAGSMDKDSQVRRVACEALSRIDRDWPTKPQIKRIIEKLSQGPIDVHQRDKLIELLQRAASSEEDVRESKEKFGFGRRPKKHW